VSVVIDYLESTYKNSCAYGGHSWQVINQAMKLALSAAIRGRFQFEKEDFHLVSGVRNESGYAQYKYLGLQHWIGDSEYFYKMAIESGNKSACISFEFWVERKPFIFQGKRLGVGSSIFLRSMALENESPDYWWTVGSFSESGEKINLHTKTRRKALTVKELKELEKKENDKNPQNIPDPR
jgi:hypothetical protein